MKTVLVIDDSEEFCSLARVALEKAGYAVDTCRQVEPALELLQTGLRPSLVVLDALMPGVRRWRKDQPRDAPFQRILPAERIYRTPRRLDIDHGLALHTVTVCDLARRDLDCDAMRRHEIARKFEVVAHLYSISMKLMNSSPPLTTLCATPASRR